MEQSPKFVENLKRFDYYGIRPSLFFKGEAVKGTGLGLFLTMMLVLMSGACLYYFGQNLFFRQNPFISYHDEYDPLPDPIVINPENEPFFVEINNESGVYITEKNMISVGISQTFYKNQKKISTQSYEMEICNETHIEKLNKEAQYYFRSKNLSNFFCIPKNIKNLTIEGAFDQEIFKAIKITFSLCTNKNYCLNTTTIKDKIKAGYIGVFFMDVSMDPGNYENPKKQIPKEVFTNFFVEAQKELDIYFQNSYLVSEEGLVFQEYVEQQAHNYNEFHDMNFFVPNNDFLKIYLKMKQIRSIYERSYTKIQDLLGLLGGFLNIFYIVGFCLNSLYTRIAVVSDILLEIFTVKIQTKRRSVHLKESLTVEFNKVVPIETINDNFTPLTNERKHLKEDIREELNAQTGTTKNDENQLQKDIEELFPELKLQEMNRFNKRQSRIPSQPQLNSEKSEEFDIEFSKNGESKSEIEFDFNDNFRLPKRKMENPKINILDSDIQEITNLNLNSLDYLYYYTGFFETAEREKKKLIINKGMEIFQKFLDVKFIIQKFYEFEKIKQIVLTDVELELFEFLPKPEIIVNYKHQKKNLVEKNWRKHSVHSRIFMRSNSVEEIRNRASTVKSKKSLLLRKVTHKDPHGKKFTTLLDVKNKGFKPDLN